MCRFALEIFSAPELAYEFSIAGRNLAANRDDMGAAFDFESFKRIVIEIHLVGFRRNLSAIVWIVNHEISVITLRFVPGGPSPMTNGFGSFNPSNVVANVGMTDSLERFYQ